MHNHSFGSNLNALQTAISDSPFLYTDASDYGIDGKEYPVAFVSKSLSQAQLHWAVIQKESYAIFFVYMHLKSLLRDQKFALQTDHRNLLYISEIWLSPSTPLT
jgi:RNase H-like domain found in reverse transcriptase